MNDLNKTLQPREHDRCPARQGRAAVPEKFSYPKKPVTLHVPVIFTGGPISAECLGDAIRYHAEVAGIVPYDWEHISPVPEAYQFQMRTPDDKFYSLYFGFDTMDEAMAVKAEFDPVNVDIWTEAEEREITRTVENIFRRA
jgi:hypothetical protein